jgi:glucose-1-phosphate thymidylyltransferase
VRTLEKRQGLQVGSPDEIAFEQGWIDGDHLKKRAEVFKKNDYGRNLYRLLKN